MSVIDATPRRTPDAPPVPTLVYDDQCGFCRRWVARLKRWDRHDRIALLPLRSADAGAVTGKTLAVLRDAAHVALPSGEVVAGAAAFRALCRYLPGGWIPRVILAIPGVMPIAERVYRRVARTWGPVGGPGRSG